MTARAVDKATLVRAAEEVRFLLGRGYARDDALEMACRRHRLPFAQKEMLRRGVLDPAVAASRRRKLIGPADLRGEVVGVDGHNVIITLASALAGGPLVRADDGVIRDTARGAAGFRLGEAEMRALELAGEGLRAAGAGTAVFHLDAPVSHSARLAELIRRRLEAWGLAGDALVEADPDLPLAVHPGPAASSDGALIDACARPVDLAGWIIAREGLDGHVLDLHPAASA